MFRPVLAIFRLSQVDTVVFEYIQFPSFVGFPQFLNIYLPEIQRRIDLYLTYHPVGDHRQENCYTLMVMSLYRHHGVTLFGGWERNGLL